MHLAVAYGVFTDVSLCCSFSSRDVLDGICDLNGSVSEGFPTYFLINSKGFVVSNESLWSSAFYPAHRS